MTQSQDFEESSLSFSFSLVANAYRFGGLDKSSVNVLRLLSELEGSYQMLKYMGFQEDMETLDNLKKKYYALYFKLNKEEKQRQISSDG